MVSRVLLVVDGSVPSHDAASVATGLLSKAADILVLQVVPQLPHAWNAWPAFPDSAEDLAKAWAYVSEVGHHLETLGWNVSTRVHFSLLSAAEMDGEILKLTETLRPDLICLALMRGRVTARIVGKALMPVLVAGPLPRGDGAGGRRNLRRHPESVLVHRGLLLNPAAALVFRYAGIL